MARRRLSPEIPAAPLPPGATDSRSSAVQYAPAQYAADVPRAEHFSGAAPERKSAFPPPPARGPGAPIARVAAEAAGQAALDEVIETLRRAEAEGRMVLEIPLADIATDHLARDRIASDAFDADEDMAALIASLRAHGQRVPIEVVALRGPTSDEGRDGGFARGRLPYGLISGWRRLTALGALHAETGEERFATVKALARQPASAAEAYVAMVEENEIRLGLSQYERARVAALAVDRGVFPDESAALRALFAGASRAKRSRIRAFVEIFRALDGALAFPAHLPERLGLRVVEQIRAGHAEAIEAALAGGIPSTPEEELSLLERVVDRLEAPGRSTPGGEGETGATRRAADEDAGEGAVPPVAGSQAPRGGASGIGASPPVVSPPPVPEGAVAATAVPRPPVPEPAGEARGERDGWRWERIGAELELGRNAGAPGELRLRGAEVTEALVARLRAALGV